jgi:transposase
LVESILVQLKENDEIVERLKTILGIGEFFAMLIRHEIDKIERFPTSNKLCAYAGLVPSTYSSGPGARPIMVVSSNKAINISGGLN